LPARCSNASQASPAGSTGRLARLRQAICRPGPQAVTHRHAPRHMPAAGAQAGDPHSVNAAALHPRPWRRAHHADVCQAIPSAVHSVLAYIPITPRHTARHE
jgi:hypothetical protein